MYVLHVLKISVIFNTENIFFQILSLAQSNVVITVFFLFKIFSVESSLMVHVVYLQIVQEYERAVIFRLGKALPGVRGPGKYICNN